MGRGKRALTKRNLLSIKNTSEEPDMKKIRIPLILGMSILLYALCAFSSSAASPVPEFRVAVSSDGNSGEAFCILPDGDNIFLPSTVDIQSVRLLWNGEAVSYGKTGESPIGSCDSGSSIDLSPMLSKGGDSQGNVCYDVTFSTASGSQRYIFYHDSKLPVISIETSKGLHFVESSKNNRDKEAQILILDENGKSEYHDKASGTTSEIKGRGNATWSYYKKPYQIKLSSKQSLFGMEPAKTWILLANYVDQSGLHNALAFQMGADLNLPYNIEYQYVNLYVDGSYRGIYMLCEKVQIGSGRIDIAELEKQNEAANPNLDLSALPIRSVTAGELIEDSILTSYTYTDGMQSPSDISGGYLVELDNVWGAAEPCRFTTENGNTYVVKSPEYASREEMEYIARLFADMEEAIYSADGYNRRGKHYSEYIDMESFAGVYVVEELLKNWDAYLSSMFFYKDIDINGETAKIYMGPLWDLDNILGNLSFETYATDTEFLWAQNGEFSNYVRALAAPLMRHDDFASLVSDKFGFLYLKTQDYLAKGGWIEKTSERISESVAMDRIRWKSYDPASWVLNTNGTAKVSTKFVHFRVYGSGTDFIPSTALGYLRYFLSERADALLLSIGGGVIPTPIPEESTSSPIHSSDETTQQPAYPTSPDSQTANETTAAPAPTVPSGGKGWIIACAAGAAVVLLLVVMLFRRGTKKHS